MADEEEITTVRSTVEEAYDRIESEGNDPAPADPAPADPVVADPIKPVVVDPAPTDPIEPVVDPAEPIIPVDPVVDPAADPAPIAAEATPYPEHWDPSFKQEFESAPPGVQKFLMERHKSMEADYTRKTMENADFMRDYAPVRQILAPFEQSMKANNIPPAELIRRWAVAENHLNRNPEEGIKALAAHYGVDLVQLADNNFQQAPSQQPVVDPMVQNLTTQVQDLQNTISGQQTDEITGQLNVFADEKTEGGQPAHPYFDELIPEMMQLLNFERSQGRTPGINDLYNTASRMNTSVFEKITAAQQNAAATNQAAQVAATKAQDEARQKAKQATDAASSVNGDPGSGISPDNGKASTSVRSAVNDAWDLHAQ